MEPYVNMLAPGRMKWVSSQCYGLLIVLEPGHVIRLALGKLKVTPRPRTKPSSLLHLWRRNRSSVVDNVGCGVWRAYRLVSGVYAQTCLLMISKTQYVKRDIDRLTQVTVK